MKRLIYIILTLAAMIFVCCSPDAGPLQGLGQDLSIQVKVRDFDGLAKSATKVTYSGNIGEHTEFETGDCFGLFVVDADDVVKVSNVKVYCSGLDNEGKSVWSIFKDGSSAGNTSNYPISDFLGRGSHYFAYFPYDESLSSITTVGQIKSIVSGFCSSIPSDQSASLADYDLLVASNIADYEYGKVTVEGKAVSLEFAHPLAMLRFCIPAGSTKYEYRFSGADFTPYLCSSTGGLDEYKYLFNPGEVLDISIKYLLDNKLYKIETGHLKELFPIATQAGHCYNLDENAPKVAYSAAVDMGTSVMWCSFNLGAEDNPEATAENVCYMIGTIVMWGTNTAPGSYGSAAYTKYNEALPEGCRPSELSPGFDFSGNPLYDAATNLWRGKWRTPTSAEWQELINKCDREVVKDSDTGATVIKFTSKTTKNVIRLRYAGYYDNYTASSTANGYYWSSSSNPEIVNGLKKGYSTYFSPTGGASINKTANLYTGLPLRPVYTK
ncbi:MAG: fimbrillin family protein [Candidatus Cryptobacteroides sp.]